MTTASQQWTLNGKDFNNGGVVNQYQDLIDWCTSPISEFTEDTHIIQFYITFGHIGNDTNLTYAGPMIWKPRTPPGLMLGHFVGRGRAVAAATNCQALLALSLSACVNIFMALRNNGVEMSVEAELNSGDGIGEPANLEGRLGLDVTEVSVRPPDGIDLLLNHDDGGLPGRPETGRAAMTMIKTPLIPAALLDFD